MNAVSGAMPIVVGNYKPSSLVVGSREPLCNPTASARALEGPVDVGGWSQGEVGAHRRTMDPVAYRPLCRVEIGGYDVGEQRHSEK